MSTNLGQSVSFFNQNGKNPYVQRWQFALQRSLPWQSVLEVSYVGNRGVRQRISRNLDSLPNQYLSTSPFRDQATINLLSAQVPNPFYPLLPGTSLSGTTVARSQLLMPYPQFTGVSVDVNQGYSWYHSMQTRFEKRFSAGFTSSVSWTWSKLMEARSYLNGGDPMPEKVISDQDRTHRLVVTAIYELPFGKGRRIGRSWNGFASRIISGWQASGIYQGQSGAAAGLRERDLSGKSARHSDCEWRAHGGPLVQYRCGIRAELRVAAQPELADPEFAGSPGFARTERTTWIWRSSRTPGSGKAFSSSCASRGSTR